MVDLRIASGPDPSVRVGAPSGDGRGHAGERQRERPRERERGPAAVELAVALSRDAGAAIEARYEEDADGQPRIRLIDGERGGTIAVVTPEELRALAERTGLPPGLLLRATS